MIGALERGTVIDDRYRILGVLGEGNSGTTYRAETIGNGEIVALKALSLRGADWKLLDLFEREAAILKTLNHPAIPSYRDSFFVDQLDEGSETRVFYLAQTLAPGRTLADWVRSGWRATEPELRSIASQLLTILTYLQRLKPPIIHRDIKPQNILRSEDGQLFLVDFGAVGHTYHSTMMRGSTVVGTFGYMAPEQFRGQANASTDLYGLGATLLFLLTRRSPAELPTAQLALQFRDKVQLGDRFCDWLESLLAPDPKQRPLNAAQALASLPQGSPFQSGAGKQVSGLSPKLVVPLAIATIGLLAMGQFRYALINAMGQHHNLANALKNPNVLSIKTYLAHGGGWFMTAEERLNLLISAINHDEWTIADPWIRERTIVTAPSTPPLIHRLLQHRDPQKALQLLEKYPGKLDLNQLDHDGRTALMIAPTEAIALWLLDRGANPSLEAPDTPSFLYLAQSKGWNQAFTKAAANGLTPDAANSQTGSEAHSLAFNAIQSENLASLKQVLAAGSKLRPGELAQLRSGAGLGYYLSRLTEGNRNWLIDALPRIDERDRHGQTLLHVAAQADNPALVSRLISAGIRVDIRDNTGKTALDLWSPYHHSRSSSVGSMLIAAGSPPTKTASFPLHEAVRRADLKEVDRLLRDRHDANEPDAQGKRPLDYNTTPSVTKRLREAGGRTSDNPF
jgi:serine/threonine protein kinase/ankyrin repeat protein